MSSSTAKILRKPARKMACESATITRMNCSLLSIGGGATLGSPVLKAALAMYACVGRASSPAILEPLPALETILVNHHSDTAPSILLTSAHHATPALDLHIVI